MRTVGKKCPKPQMPRGTIVPTEDNIPWGENSGILQQENKNYLS